MEDLYQQRQDLQKQIVEVLIHSLENGALSADQATVISTFVLEQTNSVTSQEDLQKFLQVLSTKWEMFTHILTNETGKQTKKIEDEVAEGVLLLTQHGKIDEALKLAKSATT